MKKLFFYTLLTVCIWGFLSHDRQALAQNAQSTHNTADEALKSDLRVDPTTLGLNITIPLGNYPGRSGLNVPVGMSYSSKGIWHMEYSGYYTEGTCCAPSFGANPQGLPSDNNYSYVSVNYGTTQGSGWGPIFRMPELVNDFGAGVYNFDGDPCPACELNQRFFVMSMRVMLPDGSTHELRRSDTVYTSSNRPTDLGAYVAVDGSRLRYVEGPNATGTLYLPDGSRYLMGNQANKYIDRNGNTLLYNSDGRWTDTLGRTVGLLLANNPATPTSDQIYTLTGVGGVPRNYVFRYKYLKDARGVTTTNTTGDMNVFGQGFYPGLFHSDGGTRVTPPSQFNPAVLTEIELPDSTKYEFHYNEFGEVDKVVYPTGGYERYTYAVIPGLDPVNAPYDQTNRGVTDRWVSPSGGGGDELHTHYEVSTSPDYKVTVTNPDNSYTERRLLRGRGPGVIDFGFDDSRAGMPYDERVYTPSGQMLKRKLTEWSQSGTQSAGSLSATATRDPRVTKEVEILLDTNGGNALTVTTTYQYDPDLNVISTTKYDFTQVSQATAQSAAIGSFTAVTPLLTSQTTYLVNDPAVDSGTRAAYRARNLISLPSSTRTRAGGATGAIMAQSEIKYDEPGFPLLSYGTVTGWVDPQTTVRGNPTTSRRWLDTSGGWLQSHYQYDQCGSARKTWDANDVSLANPSQVSYEDSFSDNTPRNTYAFPTSTTSSIPDPGLTGFGSNAGLMTTTAYDFATGRVTSTTDSNGKTTTYEYNDPFNRIKKETRPDGGTTSYVYDRSMNAGLVNNYVRTLTTLDSSRLIDSYQFFDGLGRPNRTFFNEGGSPAVLITRDTQYDAMGRVYRVSNPYRTNGSGEAVNPPGRWATTEYDYLGRVTKVTTPDGARVGTAYNGVQVLVTDQADRQRVSRSDALGRLTDVWEVKAADPQNPDPGLETVSFPTPAGVPAVSTGYRTSYTYDVLGNLRKVTQGSQLRFFMYDSLSRLVRAKNPEQTAGSVVSNMTDSVTGNSQWSIAYGYDDNGNLTARVDALNVTTNYTYDRLNRNTTVTYTRPAVTSVASTPDVKRYYDNAAADANGLGRLYYSEAVGVSATYFDSYDAAGRPLNYHQVFGVGGAWGQPFNVTRSYDKAGNVTSQTYPSGRTASYTYDAAGRLASFAGNLGDGVARTYSTGVSYGEFGGIQQEQFGTQTPLYRKLHYNVRGQLFDTRLSSVAWATDQWNWNRGALLNYYSAAELTAATNAARALSGSDNNGNLRRAGTYVPLEAAAVYTEGNNASYAYYQDDYDYDALNRLSYVAETAGGTGVATTTPFKQTYTYDRFGNRTINSAQTFGVSATQFELAPQTNQEVAEPSNRLYAPGDSARAPSQKLMRYDAAGNLVYDAHTGQGARIYDAENRMTQAQDVYQQWSTYTYDADGHRARRLSVNQETWQVYGSDGELLAEYRAGAAPMTSTKEYGYRGGELLVTMSSGDDQRLKRFVTNLYYGALRRDPTPQELADASNQLSASAAQGKDQLLGKAKQVARALFTQTSYETLSPVRTDAQYVSDLYYAYMQRAADDSGLGWWVSQLSSKGRSGVCDDFQNSIEFDVLVTTLYGSAQSDNQRTEQFVTNLYLGAYGRFPTQPELQQQRDALNAEAAKGQDEVKAQAETMGRAMFAAQAADLSLPAQQFVTNLYEGFLQRGPDAQGLSFWTTQAGSTVAARQAVLSSFATCPPFRELSGALYRETLWLVDDHLGTPRMVVDRSGSLVGIRRHDYLPFGGELAAGTGGRAPGQGYSQTDGNRKRWAELERDGETGLDYAQARYFSNTQGRFTGVDPGNRQARRDMRDPQSWNGYAYVNNNPLGRIDPNGTDFWDRLRNAFFYGYWVENDQIATMEQERREWLSQYYYERDDEGNWRPFDASKLSRQDVFDKYKEVKYFYEQGKLHELSDKEIIEAWSNVNPALKDDPYHPDEVTKRQNNELKDLREKMQSTGREAERLGFDRRIAPQKAPFNSHGQDVFTDGNRFITPDVDGHNGGVWKMFDRSGNRLGTYNADLTVRIGK